VNGLRAERRCGQSILHKLFRSKPEFRYPNSPRKNAKKLAKLEERLHRRMVGQDEAVRAVSDAVRLARAGLREGRRPVATFLFLGPTGVGKTELAKALAEAVYGGEDAMIALT